MKNIITIILIVILYILITPLISVYHIFSAIDNFDDIKLSQYINYPKLRQNLSHQLYQQVERHLGLNSNENNLLDKMISKAGHIVVTSSMQQVLTPDNVGIVLRSGILSNNTLEDEIWDFNHKDKINCQYKYTGVNEFTVTINHQNQSNNIDILLERDGLVNWKVTNVIYKIN